MSIRVLEGGQRVVRGMRGRQWRLGSHCPGRRHPSCCSSRFVSQQNPNQKLMSSLLLVVDAQAAANVEELEVKALGPDLLDEVNHEQGGVAEDVHLHPVKVDST